jgi:transcriptional coactivator p15 (PC4)
MAEINASISEDKPLARGGCLPAAVEPAPSQRSKTVPIRSIAKNARETIQVSLTEFKGIDLLDARVFVNGETEPVATKKGLSIRINLLPELISALKEAESEAHRRGLISDEVRPE